MTNQLSASLLPVCGAMLLCAGPSVAQTLGGLGNDHPPQETFTISSAGSGSFTDACVGTFDGDEQADSAFLRGGELLLGLNPGANPWWLPTGFAANDLATLTRPTPLERDPLITAGPLGVHEHGVAENGTLTSVLLEGIEWLDAPLITSGETLISSVSTEVLVGVLSDQSIALLSPSGSSWVSTPVALSSTPSGTIVAIELLDLDNDQVAEITIATSDSLYVYTIDGTLIGTYTYAGYTTTSLCVGVMSGGQGWVTWTAKKNNKDYLLVLDAAGVRSLTMLGTNQVVAARPVYWSDTGRPDLALSLAGTDELWILHNSGNAWPVFTLNDYTAIDLPAASPNGAAEPGVGDIDMDGDEDLLLPIQSQGRLLISRNALENHEELEPVVSNLENWGELVALEYAGCGTGPNPHYTLSLRIARPGGSLAASANALAYTIWAQPDTGHPSGPGQWATNPVAVVSQQLVTLNTGDTIVAMQPPNPNNTGCGVDGVTSSNIYYVELQLLEVDSMNNVLTAFPAKLLGVQTESSQGTNQAYLAGNQVPGSTTRTIVWIEEGVPGPEPTAVGTADEMTELPNITPGTPIQY